MNVFDVQKFYAERAGLMSAWWFAWGCGSSGAGPTQERVAGEAACDGDVFRDGREKDALRPFFLEADGQGDGVACGRGQWEVMSDRLTVDGKG